MRTFIGVLVAFLVMVNELSALTCWCENRRFCEECEGTGFLKPVVPFNYEDEGFFLGLDAIWWTADEPDLDYAAKEDSITSIHSVEVVGTDWYPGVRVFAGYSWGCDGWDGRFVYTYYHNHSKDSTAAGDDSLVSILNPGAFTAFPMNSLDFADAKIDINYRTLDILWSRNFCVSRTLLMRPYLGFRTLWFDQDFKISLTDNDELEPLYVVKWKTDYTGYGMNAGIDWDLKLSFNFSINAGFAGILTTGRASDDYTAGNISSNELITIPADVEVDEKHDIGIPGYHLHAGLTWETCMQSSYFIMNVGYELNQLYNVPGIRRFHSTDTDNPFLSRDGRKGVLLHGLTMRFGLYL